MADFVLRNGRVIDPANKVDRIADVEIQDGKIVRVGDLSPHLNATNVFDASGCIVTPGLIDMHAHVYEFATPLGVNPDETCLARGVTTVVDAGSADFKGGECDSLNQVDTDLCVKCIKENKDVAVGVKVRLSELVTNDGKNEKETFRRALAASANAGLPLMVHYACSTIPINVDEGYKDLSCPGSLNKGDILTHALHGNPNTIIDPNKKTICQSVHRARNHGVLFDVGHGFGSFSWTIAELCAKENFWPDVISTDLHSVSREGPVYDLTTTMTKLLHVGMPLYDIVKAVTMTPANAIGWQDKIGSLTPNFVADVTVLKVEDVNFEVEDTQGQLRNIQKWITPVAVWKNGVPYEISKPDPTPGHNTARLLENWDRYIVKDPRKPTAKN